MDVVPKKAKESFLEPLKNFYPSSIAIARAGLPPAPLIKMGKQKNVHLL